MRIVIDGSDIGGITLNEQDKVASIAQNIAVIVATRMGDVPLYPEFGLERKFESKPINVAKQMMIAELDEAIEAFEPRAHVVSIEINVDEKNPGRFIPKVEVDI